MTRIKCLAIVACIAIAVTVHVNNAEYALPLLAAYSGIIAFLSLYKQFTGDRDG